MYTAGNTHSLRCKVRLFLVSLAVAGGILGAAVVGFATFSASSNHDATYGSTQVERDSFVAVR